MAASAAPGLGVRPRAGVLGKPVVEGRELLRLHRETYPRYWRWSDAVQDFAMLRGYLQTVFGWGVHVGHDANPRSLRNFPLQGNGAEMLRLACCLATERGIRVCCPVHDALLVEAPAAEGLHEVATPRKQSDRVQDLLHVKGRVERVRRRVLAVQQANRRGKSQKAEQDQGQDDDRLQDALVADRGGQAGGRLGLEAPPRLAWARRPALLLPPRGPQFRGCRSGSRSARPALGLRAPIAE